jgi:DNA-binding transcriptional ArsR family regulator
MRTGTKQQIIDIIKKTGGAPPSLLSSELGISPQAVHRHLRQLCETGIIERIGAAPKILYRSRGNSTVALNLVAKMQVLKEILGAHPAVQLVTLFGSQARGTARADSDIDLLVWIDEAAGFSRQDLWGYWDRQAAKYSWKDKASLVVKPLRTELTLHTLLLDFPEEHLLVFDRSNWFPALREAVIAWREKWGAEKIPSFGGKHSWRYSTRVKRLSQIDFRLELKNVA